MARPLLMMQPVAGDSQLAVLVVTLTAWIFNAGYDQC